MMVAFSIFMGSSHRASSRQAAVGLALQEVGGERPQGNRLLVGERLEAAEVGSRRPHPLTSGHGAWPALGACEESQRLAPLEGVAPCRSVEQQHGLGPAGLLPGGLDALADLFLALFRSATSMANDIGQVLMKSVAGHGMQGRGERCMAHQNDLCGRGGSVVPDSQHPLQASDEMNRPHQKPVCRVIS